jgi:integrase
MRPGELLGLRWRDIDWRAETITVAQQVVAGRGGTPLVRPTTKTREERDIVLPPGVVEMLRAHRADQDTRRLAAATWEDNDLMFATGAGRPLTPKNVQRLLKELIALADVPDIPMYGQRHTHATLLIEAGRPINEVAQRMGHDPAVLMKTYVHVTQRMSRESANTIGHILLDA